jgi:hypothetical protein
MRGRKRKFAIERQPNGQPRRKAVDVKEVAQTMPHRREVAPEIRHDPMAETKLGRLRLVGRITGPQYESGVKYRDIVGRYRAAICAPRGIATPTRGGEMSDEMAIELKQKYDAAFEALEGGAGNRAARAVAHVAVYDRPDFNIADLRLGLSTLAAHFGLTRVLNFASRNK